MSIDNLFFKGQYWLTSWGYKTELPVDNTKVNFI